ncbi:hypothetical protein [Trinickia mobilis]|nr:hypothetical protein [Trinickia mobilis]
MSPFCLIDVAQLRKDATAPNPNRFRALCVRFAGWMLRLHAKRLA